MRLASVTYPGSADGGASPRQVRYRYRYPDSGIGAPYATSTRSPPKRSGARPMPNMTTSGRVSLRAQLSRRSRAGWGWITIRTRMALPTASEGGTFGSGSGGSLSRSGAMGAIRRVCSVGIPTATMRGATGWYAGTWYRLGTVSGAATTASTAWWACVGANCTRTRPSPTRTPASARTGGGWMRWKTGRWA